MATLNNKVIELKQLNNLTQVIDDRGEYIVDITEDVTLKDGDQLVMRNAFLDTSGSSSDQIKIDEDLDLIINFVPYVMDSFSGYSNASNNSTDPWTYTDDQQEGISYGPVGTVTKAGGNFIGSPTGLPLYKTKLQFGTPDLGYLKTVANVFNTEKFGTDKNQFWGGGPSITLQYEDWGGNIKQFHYNIPKTFIDWSKPDKPETNGRTPRGNSLELPFHIPCKIQSVKNITSQEIMDDNKLYFFGSVDGQSMDFFYEASENADIYRQLEESTITISLKAGIYNPADIANIISTKLQTASVGDFVSSNGLLGQNDTLVANKNMVDRSNRANNTIAYASSGFRFTSGDASGGYVPLAYGMQSDGYWSGASQIALEFDTDANKFYWSYLHTPAYDTNGELNVSILDVTYSAVGMIPANLPLVPRTQIPKTTIYIKKAGGIAFTSLQPADFWSKQLGFNLDNLCITPNYIIMGEGLYDQSATMGYPDINMLKEGITSTSPRIINDINILKNTTFNKVSTVTTGQPVNTTEIYADNQVLEQSIANGYWYIDITSNFNNNVISNQENYKNTVGIVSNYFNANSYTSGNSGDSIIYTHKGQDQTLSNFRVKIMDSNRSLSSLLGNDNTIFVELVKNKSPVEQIIQNEQDAMKAKEIIKNSNK